MNANLSLGLSLQAAIATPLYQQIVDQLAQRIRRGVLPVGFRLPPSRVLAGELGTHRNTVVRAYEELNATGFVESVVGRGTFVVQLSATQLPAAPREQGLPWASLLAPSTDSEQLRLLKRMRRAVPPPGAVDLAGMQPPRELLPHQQLRRCLDHILRTQGSRVLGYGRREGVLALREQIAALLAERGVPASAEQIVVTSGSQQGLDMLARALVQPGDRVLVDNATYAGALNLLNLAGAQVVGVPADEQGPSIAAIDRLSGGRAKLVYLMPNCNNPTGATIAVARRHELVAWSRSMGVPLVEDDYGADLELEGQRPPPHLRALDPEVIYLSTFSKVLIPALRVGFMICPEGLRERMVTLKHTIDLGTSALLQHALAEFLERGYLRAHYKRILPEYRRRRDALDAALRRHMPAEVSWTVPQRGVVLWLRLPAALDPEEVYEAACEMGVVVAPGTLNTAGPTAEGGVRLTYCGEPIKRLQDGAKRLGKALNQLLLRRRRRKTRTPAAVFIEGV